MSQIVKCFSRSIRVSYNHNNLQNYRKLSITSKLFKESDTKDENKSSDNKSSDNSSVESVKETEVDEFKLGPNEGVYDPSTDPYFYHKLIGYKYPQYFTRIEKQLGLKRGLNIMKSDFKYLKETGRVHRLPQDQPPPHHSDYVIFGGGIIGSAIAYFIKQRVAHGISVVVIERDPTYTRASTTQSIGGIRQQFSLKENILMSLFGIDFLRDVKKHLSVLDSEPPDIGFHPHGHLLLATASSAEQLIENHRLQTELGAYVELYTPDKLKERFPWINTQDIVIGSYGVQNEGWFDPWALLLALKTKAETLGVEYIEADVLDFNLKSLVHRGAEDPDGMDYQTCNHVIYRQPDGYVKQMEFALGIVCCGANSGQIAQKLEYGQKAGPRSHALPVEPRKRYVYVFNSPDGPGIDFPLLMDPSSVYCRREGLGGNFICGRNPSENEEPDVSNLDVDYSYFESQIRPVLTHRVPAFKNLTIKGAWAGFYEYNTFDQNPIIGRDPYFGNMFWATGFSGHGIQMAPAVGRAMMELLLDDGYQTIDLSRFSWGRLFTQKPVKEAVIS